MRHPTALALLLLLSIASSAFALGDDMDSEHQTQGYGRIFGGVCAALAALIVLIGGYFLFRQGEHQGGRSGFSAGRRCRRIRRHR